ncbi:MAG: translation elongation factor 4, partial [Desulfobacula sp.]|nr:translation elongation factor 4 [Desulfobacula sp.]
MKLNIKNIRNFSIIAHIDHGKSTLSDRLIQLSGIISERDMKDQILDSMDIERERGITIKSQTVSLPYTAKDGTQYLLNLIDTPGHVDFSYEVSRALASCEGALILVDASQGVEAQTLANLYLAMEHDLEIIPVINKIDLPSAEIDWVKDQIEEDLGLDSDEALAVSAKAGTGVDKIFQAVVDGIPAPVSKDDGVFKALIFDSHYDAFRGTIIHSRIFDGSIKKGDKIRFISNEAQYKVEEVGLFQIERQPVKELVAGQVGYFIAGIKNISDVKIGDTVTMSDKPCEKPMEGFREPTPVVFSSMSPNASHDYEELTAALEKLKLNDSSLIYEKDSSAALGPRYTSGFCGLLHLEVVQERL